MALVHTGFKDVVIDESGKTFRQPQFVFDGTDAAEDALITGPAAGTVTLADGTSYNVTPAAIHVASPEHAKAVAYHIAKMHEASGKLGELVHGDLYDPEVHVVTVVGDETSHAVQTTTTLS